MVADRIVVQRLLAEMERAVATLRRHQSVTLAELETSPERAWALEHGLQIAIQALLDVGSHILAADGAGGVEEYADIPVALAERGVLPSEYAESIRGMAGFRNLLVHGYARVDLGRLLEFLRTRLDDFDVFAGHVVRYLDTPR